MTDPTNRRRLGLPALVLFGVAYLAPLIVLGTFGVVAQASRGASAASYLLALLAMMLTALSYSRMARLMPVAGSAYTYVRNAIDDRVGFMVGWAILLDYLFLPMVIWLIGAAYLTEAYPAIPAWTWILAFIVLTTVLNVIGFKIAKTANALLMGLQFLIIAIFVALAVAYVMSRAGTAGLVSALPFLDPHSGPEAISAGAAIAAYSFLGFDAVSTLTEEAQSPQRTVPAAIWLTASIGGGIFILVAYTAQLVHPGAAFADPAAAAMEIARRIGGAWFAAVLLIGMIIAQLASGIAAQAAGARLIYAMARDGVLPKRGLGRLHPVFGTPAASVVLTGVVGLLAFGLTVESSTSFINFGAFSAFAAVNLSVIALWWRGRGHRGDRNAWAWVVAPACGAAIDLWLLSRLDGRAVRLGLIWVAIGFGVLIHLTRGFRRPTPCLQEPNDSGSPASPPEPPSAATGANFR
ncbi:MAG: APC family permease [Gammaproteobacteria bacterium]|nr:APC family permease [Gammaproteobacteria bacterium]